MEQKDFAVRLARLRSKKGVSARDMSLSLGQNAGYINTIESGKALPSMSGFFLICEYLNITPSDFFDMENKAPSKISVLNEELKKLTDIQLESICLLVRELNKK